MTGKLVRELSDGEELVEEAGARTSLDEDPRDRAIEVRRRALEESALSPRPPLKKR